MKTKTARRLLCALLVLALAAGAMAVAVFATDPVVSTGGTLVLDNDFVLRNTMTVSEAEDYIRVCVDGADGSQVSVYPGSGYTGALYTYDGVSMSRCNGMDMLDPEVAYWVGVELWMEDGYVLPAALVNFEGEVTDFTLIINGAPVVFAEGDTTGKNKTYHTYYNWGDTNIFLLVPLANHFGQIDCSPFVTSVTVEPASKTIQKGTSFTLTAKVQGGNLSVGDDAVVWSIHDDDKTRVKAGTTVNNGVVTVAADEEIYGFRVVATSVLDEEKYCEVWIGVSDSAPTFTLFSFDTQGTYNASHGGSYYLSYHFEGTEFDVRSELALSGQQAQGTYVENFVYDNLGFGNVYLVIDPLETATTLTLTLTSVAHPEFTDTLTVLLPELQEVRDIYISVDYGEIFFDEEMTEGELDDIILENIAVDAEQMPGGRIDFVNSGLCYFRDGEPRGIGGGQELIDISKNYALCLFMELQTGNVWYEEYISSNYEALHVYLNGEACEIVRVMNFNEYSNGFYVYVKPAWREAELVGANMALGEDLSLNFGVKVNNAEAKLGVRFVMNGKTVLVTSYTENDGVRVYGFKGIAPHEMCDEITATVVVLENDGVTVASEVARKVYSIMEYLSDLMERGDLDETTKRLIDALRVYSRDAAAYMECNKSLDSYIVAFYEESDALPTDGDKMVVTGNKNADCRLLTAGVRFGALNRVFIKLRATGDFTVTVNGTVYTAADCEELEANVYKLTLDPLAATELDTVYTVVLNDGEADVATMTFGVAAYAYARNAGEDGAAKDLALAVYRYGLAAKSYAEARS